MFKKLKSQQVFRLLCIFYVLVFLFVFSMNVSGDVDVPPEDKTTTVWLSKIRQSGQNYWTKLRETLSLGHSHFFPPNFDFRGKEEAVGAGEKVKDAATQSFQMSKETMEKTASSAADVASDTTKSVKEKVKKSVSSKDTPQEREGSDEL